MKLARPVKPQLARLKKVGATVELRLNDVGIDAREDLSRIGPAEAYLRMQAQSARKLPICCYLYSLEGALTDRHWDDVPETTKALLLKEISRAQTAACRRAVLSRPACLKARL